MKVKLQYGTGWLEVAIPSHRLTVIEPIDMSSKKKVVMCQ
jgi:hypothetical protein